MKRLLPVLVITLLFSLSPFSAPKTTQVEAATETEPFAGDALCLPGTYLQQPANCLPLGPSAELTDLARKGLTFPIRPLQATSPDPMLGQMTEQYANIKANGDVPVYASMEAAAAHTPSRYLGGGRGLKYVSILQRVENGGVTYYQMLSGEWLNASDTAMACCVTFGRFSGMLFKQTPRNTFGWILSPTTVKDAPGYQSKDLRDLNREDIVQVFAQEKKDGTNWLMIGLDEWVDDQYVGRVDPTTTVPTGVDNNRWIEVNLAEQTLSVYDQGQMVFATLIATGVKPFYTRPGLFKIEKKKEVETMSGAFEGDKSDYYYLEDVPYTMYFDEARALHGAYWRTYYGYPASHGCVNLSPGDSHWLFDWAHEGDWVYVWDPTGETPTDPAYYGSGGA